MQSWNGDSRDAAPHCTSAARSLGGFAHAVHVSGCHPAEPDRPAASTFTARVRRDVDGVHDARVVTRRIREVLPLTREWYQPIVVDDLFERFKRIGRSLGRA